MSDTSMDVPLAKPRSARMACSACMKRPDPDESKTRKILVCSKCQTTRYCNVDCQKANWKFHKPLCRQFAYNVNELYPKSDPDCPFTFRDLDDFDALHRDTLMMVTNCAMGALLSPPTYDGDKFGLTVYLDYDPTRHAIPAKRFTLARGRVEPMEYIDSRCPEWTVYTMREAYRKRSKERDPAGRQFFYAITCRKMTHVMPYYYRSEGIKQDLEFYAENPDMQVLTENWEAVLRAAILGLNPITALTTDTGL